MNTTIKQATTGLNAESESKHYRVPVHGGGDLDVSPSVAVFKVDRKLALDILKFSALVKANDIYKIERFDYRAEFMQFDPETNPEDAEATGDTNSVRTECDCLVVTSTEFFFSAYVKHTDASVQCEGQSIGELAEYFGMDVSEPLLPKAMMDCVAKTLPSDKGYEKGYRDAIECIALSLGSKVREPIFNEVIQTALDGYTNNV